MGWLWLSERQIAIQLTRFSRTIHIGDFMILNCLLETSCRFEFCNILSIYCREIYHCVMVVHLVRQSPIEWWILYKKLLSVNYDNDHLFCCCSAWCSINPLWYACSLFCPDNNCLIYRFSIGSATLFIVTNIFCCCYVPVLRISWFDLCWDYTA